VCGRAFDTRSVLQARQEFLRGKGVGLILKNYDYDSTAARRLAQMGSSL
jgi:dihydroxyacetone kinase